jgi:hypothetical protein
MFASPLTQRNRMIRIKGQQGSRFIRAAQKE